MALLVWTFSAQAALEIAEEHNGVFHAATGTQLQRYDMASKSWLDPLVFKDVIQALHIDESGIYAGFGTRVVRFGLSGTNETHIANTAAEVRAIHSLDNYLYLVYPSYPYGNFLSIDKQTLAIVTNVQALYELTVGSSLSPQQRKIFGRDSGTSPGDINSVALTTNGGFGNFAESPYHGAYPEASRTFVFPDGGRVVDNSGTVYHAGDLSYSGSFAGSVDDITFYGGETPIVLRNGMLLGFTKTLLPTGQTSSSLPGASRLVARGDEIFVFGPSTGAQGVSVAIVPVSQLQAETPGDAIDPRGLAYLPDSIFMDRDEVLHLFVKNLESIFRWDTKTREYTNTIPLVGAPIHAAYSSNTHTIYLAHASGSIDQLSLATNKQVPFVNSPQRPLGIATAGEFLFVCDAVSPWVTHYVYSPAGALLSSKDWNYYSKEYVWNQATRRMYFFRDDSSPNDLLAEEISSDGKILERTESPYHGEYPIQHPIRVNDAGTKVLLGSGQIYSAPALTRDNSIGNAISDAIWFGDDVVSIREIGGVAQLQHWSAPSYPSTATRQLNGESLGVQRVGHSVLAITKEFDAPRFHVLSTNLDVVYSSPVRPLAPTNLVATNITGTSVALTWSDNSDNEEAFTIYMMDASTNVWRQIAALPADSTSFVATNLAYSSFYDFSVSASNSVTETDHSEAITIKTLPDPRSPIGPPFEFAATRILAREVHLGWRDNATNEQGFRLERQVGSNFILLTNLPAGATNYVDKGLTPAMLYTYRLQAFNDFSDSESSPNLQVRTLTSDTLPPGGAPKSLRPVSVSHQEVVFAWDEEIPNEDAFVIERTTNQFTRPFVEVGRVGANQTAFSDKTVEPSSGYYYRVYATNEFGRSSYSPTLQVGTPAMGGAYLGFSGANSNIVYFAFEGPLRLERYDLQSTNWLTPLPLANKPTAMLVSQDGIYLAFGRVFARFNHELEDERFLVNADADIRVLFEWENHVYASSGSQTLSINRATGNLVWQGGAGWYAIHPRVAVAPGKLIARNAGTSPSDIISVDLKSDGSVGGTKDSPYHGDYPHANAVFVFPNGGRVVDSAGVLYNVGDLTYAGSLAGAVDDVAFHGVDIPIVARGTNVIAFSNILLETGRTSVARPAARIFAQGENIVAFMPANNAINGMEAQVIPLDELNAAEPGQAPVLHGTPFTPDDVFLDKHHVLHLFSKKLQAIFRWSATTRSELPAIPLLGPPAHVAYSAPNHTIYVAYPEGQITQIQLNSSMKETGFVNMAESVLGLETAGEVVFAVDGSGAWVSHSTYAPDGQRLSWKEWNYYSRDYVWSPANRRMYHFRDDTSPNDLHAEEIGADGRIVGTIETPYHGDFHTAYPIRVRPDGRIVLLGSGQMFDGTTLTTTASLSNPINDAIWRGSVLYTVRGIAGVSQVQRWSATYAQTSVAQFEGEPLRLLDIPEGLLLITMEEEQPRVRILSDNLATTFEKPINSAPTTISLAPIAITENAEAGTVVGSFMVQDPNAEDTHRIEIVSDASQSFAVKTNALILTRPIDFETTPTASVTVRAIDQYGLAMSETLEVQILNQNEAPTDIAFPNTSVWENQPVGSMIGVVTGSDPDVGDRLTFALVDDAGGRFALETNRLVLAAPVSFREQTNHSIRIRATDSGGLQREESFVVAVREFIPPPPTGAVQIAFEGSLPGSYTNWLEAGFAISSVGAVTVAETTNSFDPFNGTANLRGFGSNQIVIRHRSNLPFKVVALDIAEQTPDQEERSVIFVGARPGRVDVTDYAILDGVADGSGPLRDFETVYLKEQFSGLSSLTIVAGGGVAIDNIVVIVGQTNGQFLSIRPTRVHAWETDAPEGEPPYPHTALLSIERHGPTNVALQARVNLSGTAGNLRDYFISGLPLDNTIHFAPGQRIRNFEMVPLPDSSAEAGETINLAIAQAAGYSLVNASTTLYIHDNAMSAWFASEYPLESGEHNPILDANADPDGNGLSFMAEFVMGLDPAERADGAPVVTFTPGAEGLRVECTLTKNIQAKGWHYVFQESVDFNAWRPIAVQPIGGAITSGRQDLHYAFTVPQRSATFIRVTIEPQ